MNASASAKRNAGSFSSACMTIASSSGVTSGLRALGGAGRSLVLERDRHDALAFERNVAGEQLVEDDPDRVQIPRHTDRVALRLLGRHVRRRAEHCARLP